MRIRNRVVVKKENDISLGRLKAAISGSGQAPWTRICYYLDAFRQCRCSALRQFWIVVDHDNDVVDLRELKLH
jgi:hypothetical protein